MKRISILLLLLVSLFGQLAQQSPIAIDGANLSGQHRVTILVYSNSDGGEPIWAGTTDGSIPLIIFENGYIRNIEDIIPSYITTDGDLWIELKKDGSPLFDGRMLYRSESSMRREVPTDPGETTEEMATHLQIGSVGETDDLVVHSPQVGFGVDTPTERIDINGAVAIREGASPTSTTDVGKVYVNDADGHLYFIDEAGNITDLTVDANAIQSISSSANITGRTEHMRMIPGEGAEITESATDDTIYIHYSLGGTAPCSSAPAAPSHIEGASTVCTGEPGAAYAVLPVDGATFYSWTVPADAVITTGIGTNAVNVVFGSTDGNVCARAMNGCGSSTQVCTAVSINRPTSPGSITGTSPVCPGQTGVSYYIASVPGATNYIWTLPPGAVLASGTGTPNITVNFGTSGGDICVQTENSCGTSTPQCMPIVMTDTPATPGMITGSTPVCEGATGVSYSISPVAEATSYTWTVPSGASVASGAGTEAITVDFGTTSGTVCVTATSICGTSSPRCLSVTVNLAPVITVNPSDQTVEEGNPATFNITATGSGLTYQWQQSTDAGSSWSNVGSSSNSYSTGSTTAGMNGYLYRCIVTGACSPADTSATATLTVVTALYDFTSHTFSNCGVTGKQGPSLSQMRSSYDTSPANWDENPAFLNVTSTGIQLWTVPEDGTYRITAAGAEGGCGTGVGAGRGAIMRGDFVLGVGDVIKILVGQQGGCNSDCGGGGGGSFVATDSDVPLIVAGGGAGAGGDNESRTNAVTSTTALNNVVTRTCGGGEGGSGGGGGGGGANYGAPGGGGFYTDGGDLGYGAYSQSGGVGGTSSTPGGNGGGSVCVGTGGDAFVHGGLGGEKIGSCYSSSPYTTGGFGGGGADRGGNSNGGGGGGYSGGAGGCYQSNPCSSAHMGGQSGGGSFNSGANQTSSVSNTGHGYVTIQKL